MSLLNRPRQRPEGSVWDVPAMSPDAWSRQPAAVWRAVAEEAIRLGYVAQLRRAATELGEDDAGTEVLFDFAAALTATELGAPIPQLFTACLLRRKAGQ